jgi:hypothetical protein
MTPVPPIPENLDQSGDVWQALKLPNPEDDQLPEVDFLQQVETAWLVCDRFDLQTDIWRGRILRTVREREKAKGEGRGSGFLHWLQERDLSKTQAYSWIELANSADTLLAEGYLDTESLNCFSKGAFIATAQASPEVQQLVTESARNGDRITRREVRQLSDEWTAMTSELLPPIVKEKTAENIIPSRYLAPLVRELEKLPSLHQATLQQELQANPDIDTLKQVTGEARYLSRYLESARQVQALDPKQVNLEQALEEALRLGCLNTAAELVAQAAQLEQAIAKLYTTWKRLGKLSDQLYDATGASTPHLRSLLQHLEGLNGEVLEIEIGSGPLGSGKTRQVRLQILPEPEI